MIILARNGKVRSFRVRMWVAAPLLCLTGLLMTGFVGATLYAVYRDDLLGTTLARQVAMQYDYEQRIAALRAELDRVTSRHLVETASVEDQVAVLLERQATIAERQQTLDALVEDAQESGIEIVAEAVRAPRPRPDLVQATTDAEPLAYAPPSIAADDIITGTLLRGSETGEAAEEIRLRPILREVHSSLEDTQARQSDALDALNAAAESEARRLSSAMEPIGLTYDSVQSNEPQGGPFVPATELHFVERAAVLTRTLEEIAALRRAAETMPVRAPLQARKISSGFGYRMDPFLSRAAMHAGIDFVAAAGTSVSATAAGTVISAGWSGGYGQMVEIRHTNGVSTRYGHLSKVLVSEGDAIAAGQTVGLVGSTGRSTGPHLHYETRRGDRAVDPAPFLAAGRAL